MKRILIDARLGWGSGIGRYVANTVPLVAGMMADVHFDALVSGADLRRACAAFADIPNLGVIESDIAPFSAREQWALEPLSRGYDLSWFTNYWVPLRWSSKFIAAVHDLLHLEPELFPASPIKRVASRAVFHKVARSAAGIAYGSRFTQREFESRFGAVSHGRVISYGIDHDGWLPFDPEQPPLKKPQILAVGASKLHKNFGVVFEAWRRARLGEHWRLVVVSPDDKLRSSISLEGLRGDGPGVDIRYGVSNENLHALYAASAVMLMPSLYEGFGLPLMEGMQSGARCIVSTAESLVEICQGAYVQFVNGRDIEGWTKALENTCAAFDNGEFDYGPLQRHNMRHAMQYSWRRVAENTAALLHDVL